MQKQEYPDGCHKIATPEDCCKYVDGRKNTNYHKQPCVAVTDVTQPTQDINNPCQPLCFAVKECGNQFQGKISNFCENKGMNSFISKLDCSKKILINSISHSIYAPFFIYRK